MLILKGCLERLAYRGVIRYSYAIYAAIGSTLTLVGRLIPAMAAAFNVGYDAYSPFYLISTLCHLITVFSAGVFVESLGTRRFYRLGLWLAAAGCGIMVLAPQWAWIVAGFSVFQIGFAFLAVGLNTVVIDARPESRSQALTYLHLFYSIGAVVGPLFSHMLTNWSGQWMTPFLVIGILFALLGLMLPLFEFPARNQPVERQTFSWQSMRILLSPVVLFLALTTSLYVGSEQGISVWMYTYLVEHHNAADLFGAALNSLFWAGLTLGRLFSGKFNARLGNANALVLFIACATISLTFGLFTNAVWLVVVSFFLSGLSFSGTFPSLLAFGSEVAPSHSAAVNGILLAAASIGSSTLPALMGHIAENVSIRSALLTAYGTTLALLISVLVVWLLYKRTLNQSQESRKQEI